MYQNRLSICKALSVCQRHTTKSQAIVTPLTILLRKAQSLLPADTPLCSHVIRQMRALPEMLHLVWFQTVRHPSSFPHYISFRSVTYQLIILQSSFFRDFSVAPKLRYSYINFLITPTIKVNRLMVGSFQSHVRATCAN